MTEETMFLVWLQIWVCCLIFVLWGQRKTGSGAGLVISYVLQLWVLHWLAAALYALPWYGVATAFGTMGLRESTIAIAGFTIGSSVLVPLLHRDRMPVRDGQPAGVLVDQRLLRTYMLVGIFGFFVFEPIFNSVPTIGALVTATSNLLLLALGMECWNGLHRQSGRRSFKRWVALSAALPLATIVTKGFLGYGFAAMLTVFAFVASFYRPRWKLVVSSAVIGFFALSLYVTYMRDRQDIRRVVWGQESYANRFSTLAKTFSEFEFFDIRNLDHLTRIDTRLNQNNLVGMAVYFLDAHPERFANGETIRDALLSPIPRMLWPNKPFMAGSGDLVSEFTGQRFAEGTSVGIGHVLEWYVNFGSFGVLFGMIFMGFVVGWLDRTCAERLSQGNWVGFAVRWVPALALLQVGGSFVETLSSAGAGWLVVMIVNGQLAAGRRVQAERQSLAVSTSAAYEPRRVD